MALANLPGIHCDKRYNDGFQASAPVGSYAANPWHLRDLHGNAAEWTASVYLAYPYTPGEGAPDYTASLRVVRGGSYRDHPVRGSSCYRVALPSWISTGTVGFRIVVDE